MTTALRDQLQATLSGSYTVERELGGRSKSVKSKNILATFESRLDSVAKAEQAPLVHYVRGEIALAEGRPMDAVAEFRLSDQEPDGPADGCVIQKLEVRS